MKKIKKLLFLLVAVIFPLLISCNRNLTDEKIIYTNDFSTSDIDDIDNPVLSTYENFSVLGFYNNSEISITQRNLGRHNAVRIRLDIFFHDSWDGNKTAPDGPDIWYMNVDDQEIINTTFSNSPCNFSYCSYQSYPEQYPHHLDSKTGAAQTDLPGRCQKSGEAGYTTRYVINKIVPHKNNDIVIKIGDMLTQDNARHPICDESWSLNSITIFTLE